jgi:hypothetical protein
MDTTFEDTAARGADRAVQTLDLDALARMDVEALGRLYARGRVTTVAPLAGRPKGRMLAVRGLDRGGVFEALRRFAGARGFPWDGKSFAGTAERGTGVNRVRLGGRHQLFPFLTRVTASVVDGAPCVALDYDLPDNPGLIRKIHDEVRDIGGGLYLGPAMWKGEGAPAFVLWFGLDTRVQAAAPGEKAS